MKYRSCFVRGTLAALAAGGIFLLAGCLGQRSYFADRPLPPSHMLQRVLVAIQNPSPVSQGALQIVDARYDQRNSLDGKVPYYFVSGYQDSLPSAILNYPEELTGYVYNSGSGHVSVVNYSTESLSSSISTLPGASSSVFVTRDGSHSFAANQAAQVVTVMDSSAGKSVSLSLPNVYKVAVNPSGTVALAFVQNSNYAYRIIHLQQPSGTVMPVPTFHPTTPWPSDVARVSCQPINIPLYCVVPVLDQNDNPIVFNRPYNTIFSSDGTTGWLLNCGPECGNTAVDPTTGQASASVSFLNLGPLNVYNFPGSTYPTPPPSPPLPTEQQRIATPGGATMAIYGNNTLYVSGQQQQSDGLWEGFLTVLNLSNNQITATYPISDGLHTKMLFGDDNTLWIGSQQCQSGWHTANSDPADGKIHNSCLTYFDLTQKIAPAPVIEVDNNGQGPAYGDLTGLCAITQWHKMYVAMGGQIHIYATTNQGITTNQNKSATGYALGTELSNYNVTVEGTAYDVAYMDALSDAAD